MAWQTPKTDWSRSDGVRDTDLNRIESNIDYLHKDAIRRATTIYVSTSGNDTTGNGTSSAPYATISKAVAMLPRNCNGYLPTIRISGGVYDDDVVISGGYNGVVKLTLAGAATIQSLTIENGALVEITGQALTVASGVTVARFSSLIASALIKTLGNRTALAVSYNSTAYLVGIDLGTSQEYGIEAIVNGRVYAHAITGRASLYSLYVATGGTIAYNNNSATGVVYTSSGGRINTGAQL